MPEEKNSKVEQASASFEHSYQIGVLPATRGMELIRKIWCYLKVLFEKFGVICKCYSKNLVLFESVASLFESYLVLFGAIYLKLFCCKLNRYRAKVTCLLHKTACKK